MVLVDRHWRTGRTDRRPIGQTAVRAPLLAEPARRRRHDRGLF